MMLGNHILTAKKTVFSFIENITLLKSIKIQQKMMSMSFCLKND